MNDVEWMRKKINCCIVRSRAMGLRVAYYSYGISKSPNGAYRLDGSCDIFPGAILLLGKFGDSMDGDIADAIGVPSNLWRSFKEGIFARPFGNGIEEKSAASYLGLQVRNLI